MPDGLLNASENIGCSQAAMLMMMMSHRHWMLVLVDSIAVITDQTTDMCDSYVTAV